MLRVFLMPRLHTVRRLTGCSGFNALRWVFEELGRQGRASTTVWVPKGVELDGCAREEARMKYVHSSREWTGHTKFHLLETDNDLIEL